MYKGKQETLSDAPRVGCNLLFLRGKSPPQYVCRVRPPQEPNQVSWAFSTQQNGQHETLVV